MEPSLPLTRIMCYKHLKNVPRQKFIDYMPSEEELDIIATIHENIPSVVAKDYLIVIL